MDLGEFQASLVYRVNSKTVTKLQRKTLSPNKQTKSHDSDDLEYYPHLKNRAQFGFRSFVSLTRKTGFLLYSPYFLVISLNSMFLEVLNTPLVNILSILVNGLTILGHVFSK
jgi:hypothetical protein